MSSSIDKPTDFWENVADWLGTAAIDVLRSESYKIGLVDGYTGRPQNPQLLADRFYVGGYNDGKYARQTGVHL